MVPTDRTRGSGHKLKNIKCHLNTEKHVFSCEGNRALEQVGRRVCEVSIRGDVQNLIGHGPGKPAFGVPA